MDFRFGATDVAKREDASTEGGNKDSLASSKTESQVTESYTIAGELLVKYCSFLLLLAGIGELVSGALITSSSRSRFVGGIYVGLAGIFSGLRGLFLRRRMDSIIGVLVFSLVAMIIAIVGAVLQAKMYSFLITLEACATPVTTPSTQCNTASPVFYSCTGEVAAFPAAYVCARDSNDYNSNSNDDNHLSNSISCSCVTSSETNPFSSSAGADDYLNTDDFNSKYTSGSLNSVVSSSSCVSYNQFGSCETLLNVVPQQMQVSYLLAVVCISLAALVVALCLVLLLRPQLFAPLVQIEPTKNSMKSEKKRKDQDLPQSSKI